jgi:hypothetical protein
MNVFSHSPLVLLEVRKALGSEEVTDVKWIVLCEKRGKKLVGYCVRGGLTI